jgi:hypothetical protein
MRNKFRPEANIFFKRIFEAICSEYFAKEPNIAKPNLKVHCPLPTIISHCTLSTTYYYFPLYTVHYLLLFPTVHCPLPTIISHCTLYTAYCPLPTVHCPLFTASYPLFTANLSKLKYFFYIYRKSRKIFSVINILF